MKFVIVFTTFIIVGLAYAFKDSCWAEKLGYPCCPLSICTSIQTDKYGYWAIHNGQWCGILRSLCKQDLIENLHNDDSSSEEPTITSYQNVTEVESDTVIEIEDIDDHNNNEIIFNYKDNLNNEKIIEINSLDELDFYKDGYHFIGAFTDNTYSTFFDFLYNNQSQTYDIYVQYEKKNSYVKQNENIDLTSYVDNLIENTNSYFPYWNSEGFKGRWNYIDGVFLNSIINLYKKTNDDKYKDFFLRFINYYISEDGTFIYINNDVMTVDNTVGYKSGELDSVCASKVLFDAYEMTGDSRYLTAIEYTYS